MLKNAELIQKFYSPGMAAEGYDLVLTTCTDYNQRMEGNRRFGIAMSVRAWMPKAQEKIIV